MRGGNIGFVHAPQAVARLLLRPPFYAQTDVGALLVVPVGGCDVDGEQDGVAAEGVAVGVVLHQANRAAAHFGGALFLNVDVVRGFGEDGDEISDGGQVHCLASLGY